MPLVDLEKLPELNRVFVGRKRELKLFEDAAHAVPDNRCSVLVFHGLGGLGKTWLCNEIRRVLAADPNYAQVTAGLVDLRTKADADKRDDLKALIFVRDAFANAGLEFAVFDLSLALAWEANRSEEPFPRLKNSWLGKTTGAANDLIGEGSGDAKDWLNAENTADFLGDEIGKIPLLGTLLKRGGRWLFSKAKLNYLHMAHDDLKRLYHGQDNALKSPGDLRKLLPAMLAVDLNRSAKSGKQKRLVLLMDEYERVFAEGGAIGLVSEDRFDAAIRDLLQHCDRLLAVFFSREALPWNPAAELGKLLIGNQHRLAGLSRTEADAHLLALPIDDAALRAAMLSGAEDGEDSVYPLLLELQIDHWAAQIAAGNTPNAESFVFAGADVAEKLEAMVVRFMRDYGGPVQHTLKRLALLRRFDRESFGFVVEHFKTGLPAHEFDRMARLSFISEAGAGWLIPHGRISEAIIAQQGEAFRKESREALFGHFDARAIAAGPLDVSEANETALLEAQALKGAVDPDYLGWLFGRLEPSYVAAHHLHCTRIYEFALESLQAALGPHHPDVAVTLNNLAGLHKAQGRYDAALPLYERDLAISEKALGPNHPDVAVTLNNLAGLYYAQGQYNAALPLYERALAILDKALGPDHPSVAATLNNLAELHKAQGRYDAALALYERALAIKEKTFGPDHPDVAATLNNLAGLHRAQGRFDDALPLSERDLAISEKALGPDHPDVAVTLNNLAELHKAQGRYDAALPLYERALANAEKTLGPDHPSLAATLNNLAGLHHEQGRYDDALPLYERSLVIKEKALGPDHPDVAVTLNNLAELHKAQGRYDAALPLYVRALAISEKALGPDHPDVAAMLSNLAGLHYAQRRYGEVLPLYERANAILERAFPGGHPNLDGVRANLAAAKAG